MVKFFFSSRRRHTRLQGDWSSDVCSSDLAGVTRFDDDPRTRDLPRIGGYNDPQPEAVLAVKPDLILAEPAPENRGPVETLARLGIAVETFPLSSLAHIEAAISPIAGFLGVPERGLQPTAGLERARPPTRNA